MINDKEFKLAWQAGWEAAINAHSGVVAAAEAVIDAFNDSYKPFEDRMLTLTSAVDNLKTTLEIGLDFR